MPVFNRGSYGGGKRSGVFSKPKVEAELTRQAEKDKPMVKEVYIGVMRAREIAQAAGIDPARVDAALAIPGTIEGAYKEGTRWVIGQTAYQVWLAEQS
jgi:hypothetical protein